MKILNFNRKSPEGVMFERQTFMVMCFTPKIIVFENSDEIDRFKRVWEIIDEIVCENKFLIEKIGDDVSGFFVDAFEEESYLMDCEDEESRKFILRDVSDMDDSNFEDCITIKLGVLNSKDMWIDMDTLKKLIFLLDSLLIKSEGSLPLKADTKKMFLDILKVWKEDLKLSKQRKYFKVEIEEE